MSLLGHIRLSVHGSDHVVKTAEISPEVRLIDYLRNFEWLRGTKYMCLEGGCGSCIVSISKVDPVTKRERLLSVNSCLVSIYQCQGWSVYTVEGIGNKKKGFHPIQKMLAHFNGTQCGFCTPGWVMTMYPLYESGTATMEQIENNFGGNICRCTGYRPILTAFKTFAHDSDPCLLGEYPDIEEIDACKRKVSEKCERKCKTICGKHFGPAKQFEASQSRWYKVYNINEIFDVFSNNPNSTYMLVGGNTARGVYEQTKNPQIYIDISDVLNLVKCHIAPDHLILGASMSLTDAISLFQKLSKENENFSYLQDVAQHIFRVAHVSVRNIGTIAGNLSIKYEHNEFPSDIFLLFETLGAAMTIMNAHKLETDMLPSKFLQYNMDRKIITRITLPSLDSTYKFKSFKIMPVAQNAHAIINAGFLFQFDSNLVVQTATIVYGGISPRFIHAERTESFLVGKALFNNGVLQQAYSLLAQELVLWYDDNSPHLPYPYLKGLAIALFYKAVLSMAPKNAVNPKYLSGGQMLERPISKGIDEFPTNKSLYPLTQPIPKIEALAQTSGEIEYITDMIEQPGQLAAYFVNTNATPLSYVESVDTTEALAVDGVIAYFDKNDIPGKNTFTPPNANYSANFFPPNYGPIIEEELFCSGLIQYYFQPVGIIVAVSQEIAIKASRLVKITYRAGTQAPYLTIRDILRAGDNKLLQQEGTQRATRRGNNVKHVLKGKHDTCFQYHYHMETQICLVVPRADGLDVFPATQWIDYVKIAIADLLQILETKVNVSVKRLGGSYGAKIVRSNQIACAAALAAYKLKKPVYMRLQLRTNMDMIGKRYPASANYEVGIDDNGVIQYLNCDYWLDYGTGNSENFAGRAMDIFYLNYKYDTWNVTANNAKTHNPANPFCRAPGHCNIIAMSEAIMEHIAAYLSKDPVDVRLANMDLVSNARIIFYIDRIRKWADFDNRHKQAEAFNQTNRWMKKGITLVPMTWSFQFNFDFHAIVAIFAGDGSVVVTHGGIETGQGINTKAAQVTAYALGIPLELVTVKESKDITSPNNYATAASTTTESVCYAILQNCDVLRARMEPVRQKMQNPTWQELVKQCQQENVDLLSSWMFTASQRPDPFQIYGVVVTEVEIDILTGTHLVNRVDIIEDVGQSLSPLVDIGQIEGAFVMGMGYWTTENLIFNKEGRLLTDSTWDYKVPGALDIPVDLRVQIPKNNPNPVGVLFSKAVAEPPLCLAVSVPLALRHAMLAGREDAGDGSKRWVPFHGPTTPATIFLNSSNDYIHYTL